MKQCLAAIGDIGQSLSLRCAIGLDVVYYQTVLLSIAFISKLLQLLTNVLIIKYDDKTWISMFWFISHVLDSDSLFLVPTINMGQHDQH